MKSMTGYAKVQVALGEKKLNIEIKTLNSKQLDLIVKLPALIRSRELEIRAMLNRLERGKVELVVAEEAGTNAPVLNEDLLAGRIRALQQLMSKMNLDIDESPMLGSLLNMTDIWSTGADDQLSDEEWERFSAGLQQAIDLTDRFRAEEGAVLEKDFHKHVDLIEEKLREIPQYESERIDTAKDRIMRYMEDAAVKDVDRNRFEQELIYYLEKLDITEEKVRLQKHIDYFRQTISDEQTCGKKLGFVAQEMGREINTTGSKANHVEIQKLVVAMKDELEKIKEQLGNVL